MRANWRVRWTTFRRSIGGNGKKSATDAPKEAIVPKERGVSRKTLSTQNGLFALGVALLLTLGATIREVNLLLALGAFFAGFAVVDYRWGNRMLRRIRVSREISANARAGEPFFIAVSIRNASKRKTAWSLVVEDEWAPAKGEKSAARPVVYASRVAGGETRKERCVVVFPRRGRRRATALTLSTRFPCGFYRNVVRFDAPAEVLVLPKIGTLTADWDAFAGNALREETAATGRSSRIPDETATVRDWRPGDPARTIHWRATAKRGRLQARDFEERKSRSILLILDLFGDSASNGGKLGKTGRKNAAPTDARAAEYRRWENVELAVSFAATLLERWARFGDSKVSFALNADAGDVDANSIFSVSASSAEPASANVSNDFNGSSKTKKINVSSEKNARVADFGAWEDCSGGPGLRRASERLATAVVPARDRFAEILGAIDPRTVAESFVFVVSVAPFDVARTRVDDDAARRKGGNDGALTEDSSSRSPSASAFLAESTRFIDVSAPDFDRFFVP